MIERLIAEANIAEHRRYAEQQDRVRLARKLFPKADTSKVEREPLNQAPRTEPRPNPLNY